METKKVLSLIVSGIVPRVKSNRKKSSTETVFRQKMGNDRAIEDKNRKNRKVFLNSDSAIAPVNGD